MLCVMALCTTCFFLSPFVCCLAMHCVPLLCYGLSFSFCHPRLLSFTSSLSHFPCGHAAAQICLKAHGADSVTQMSEEIQLNQLSLLSVIYYIKVYNDWSWARENLYEHLNMNRFLFLLKPSVTTQTTKRSSNLHLKHCDLISHSAFGSRSVHLTETAQMTDTYFRVRHWSAGALSSWPKL